MDISKTVWKVESKKAIRQFWTEQLQSEANEKSTLKYCVKNTLQIGSTHRVWKTLHSYRQDVIRGTIKARILTGTYMLQTLKAKFNQFEVDPICPLCRLENEDIVHMITRCPALHEARKEPMSALRQFVINRVGSIYWTNNFSTKEQLTSVIIDSSVLKSTLPTRKCMDLLESIEVLSRKLCFTLHMKRLNILSGG